MDIELIDRPPPQRSKRYDLSTFRVLLVEDFDFIATILASSLSELGFGQILRVNGGNPAKAKLLDHNSVLSTTNIDVLILDWLMPDGDGADLLKWMRSHRADTIRFLPAIVCSAYTSQTLVEQARDAGANEIMVKPVSAKTLAQRIVHVIEHQRPYLKTPDFFGPDRRRQVKPFTWDDRRHTLPEHIKVNHEKI